MQIRRNQPFGWAILGAGQVSYKFASDLRRTNPPCKAVVVASRKLENAKKLADLMGVTKVAETYAEAVTTEGVDAVYIATPPSEHEAHALLAMAAGKAVVIEKPFALDSGAAERIVAAATKAKVFCMEAMWTRFLPLVTEVKTKIDAGAIGEVRSFEGSFSIANNPDPAMSLFNPSTGGGALMHRGVYPLSLARFFLGPIQSIQSIARIGATGIDEDCNLILQHASGSISSVHASARVDGQNDMTIRGTKGIIKFKPPIYRPFQATLISTRPRSSKPGWSKLEAIKDHGLVLKLMQHFSSRFSWTGSKSNPLNIFFEGNGYRYEAEEVMNCMMRNDLESAVMPLSQSLEIMNIIDNAKQQWRTKL